MRKINDIRHVAIYLRKSRRDKEADVLVKHRNALVKYAKSKGWAYTIFEEEITSGERLSTRPVINKLLKEIYDSKENTYDAILVKHYDRLSRGNQKDFGTIVEILKYKDCFIATQNKTYDLNNTTDLTLLGIEGVFANTEYNMIKTRLKEGKQAGAEEGNWTNGKPPYPYIDRKRIVLSEKGNETIERTILIDPDKKKVYDLIKELFLTGEYGTEKLAIEMNQRGYLSPGGKLWSSNAISRVLLHDFHMGVSTYGKYEWKKDLEGKKSATLRKEEEWYVGQGNWEAIKTEEEHKRIIEILAEHTKLADRSKEGVFPTSGLMLCKKCGYSMKYAALRPDKKGRIYKYTKCNHRDQTGNHCKQSGVKLTEEFYQALYGKVISAYLDVEVIEKVQVNQKELEEKQAYKDTLVDQLTKQENALKRVKDAYKAGIYNLKELAEEKKKIEPKIKALENDMAKVEAEITSYKKYTRKELEQKINVFKQSWAEASTAEEQNALLKTVIKKIIYDREGNVINLEIEYK